MHLIPTIPQRISGCLCRPQQSQYRVVAAPDLRLEALDRWKELGEKLPNAKSAASLTWMVEEFGYDPEEVQCRSITRPSGWIYQAMMSQSDTQNYHHQKKKKEKAS